MKIFAKNHKVRYLQPKLNRPKFKIKKLLFLISIPLFYLLIIGGLIILLDCKDVNYGTTSFNPNANDAAWNDYYQKHCGNHEQIDLKTTKSFFTNPKNIIEIDVASGVKSITLQQVLQQIDGIWQQQFNLNESKQPINPLPADFFSNMINNPAVNFQPSDSSTVKDDLQVPPQVNQSKNSTWDLQTDNEATSFGIANNDFDCSLKIKIVNTAAFDIGKLQLTLPNVNLNIQNTPILPKTVADIQPLVVNAINTVFLPDLSNAINVPTNLIKPTYYQINLDNPKKSLDFNLHQPIKIEFKIISNQNPWHFKGQYQGSIMVNYQFHDLATDTQLATDLAKQNYRFQIENDDKNSDENLSANQVATIKADLIKQTNQIVKNYFKTTVKIDINPNDYQIAISNLKAGDNIANNGESHHVTWTITAKEQTPLINHLSTQLQISGQNNHETTATAAAKNVTIDGIWLPDDKDNHRLQIDQHYYQQTKLFNSLIANQDSLVNQIKKNSYRVADNSFAGTLQWDWNIDTSWKETLNLDVKTVHNDKVANFWMLLTKTKSIYLMTKTTKTETDYEINDFQFCFYQSNYNDESQKLFSIGLPPNDYNRSISKDAALNFTNFSYQINGKTWK